MSKTRTKELIKEALSRRGLSTTKTFKEIGLNQRYLSNAGRIGDDIMYSIQKQTGISVFEMVEDINYNKYYSESGELLKIEKI